ncbi:MAG: hypothetical protein ACYS7Y_26905 [Planctomycetota bacterium]|jgi:hypothetical protein
MSTSHRIHEAGPKNYGNPEQEVSICERSARFDLDLYGYPPDGDTAGPQQMSAGEALDMAAGIIYAVWCSYPDRANEIVESMSFDHIPDVWNRIIRRRQATS